MKALSTIVVCPRCDAVYRRPSIPQGHVARCIACGTVISRARRLAEDGWAALTLASAIMFVLANAFPVISVGVGNYHNDVTLWEATTSLVQGPWAPLAVPATVVAIVAPLLQLVLLGWVLLFACRGRRAPGFTRAMKTLAMLRPWSMVEVVMLGVIVAGIKLSDMTHVTMGAGAWCMLALVALAAWTTKRDLRWLWDVADEGTARLLRSTP